MSRYVAKQKSKLQDIADNEEERLLTELFQKYNDINIDTMSSTIFLENERSSDWLDVLICLYGKPRNLQHNGKKWSVKYSHGKRRATNVYITMWLKPSDGKPKLLLQGKVKNQYAFVTHQIPVIYKQVVDAKHQYLKSQVKFESSQ